jgi:hypothetical protein
MGDGLKRAFAAAARTRADASLTPEMRRFLEALPSDGRAISAKRLHLVCTDAQSTARQRCRRFGYADYRVWEDGARGWLILPLGRQMLAAPSLSLVNGRGE